MSLSFDAQDRRILEALQRKCRLSAQELAQAVNMSATTCWRRLKTLEETGVIDGYRAVLNREKLGYTICAFVHVSIERQYHEIVEEIEKRITQHPGVMECYTTTGDADFMLRVVATDMSDYDSFLQKFLFKLPGVSHVKSSIALRELKQTTEMPL